MDYNFIESLERERIKLNISQAKMAEKLGISLSSYKRLINGEVSTKAHEVVIKFYQLIDTPKLECDSITEKRHQLTSKMQDMNLDDLIFVECVIDYIIGKKDQ